MKKRYRNLYKEELDLWKEVTKNDKKLKGYVNNIDNKVIKKNKDKCFSRGENKIENKKNITKNHFDNFQINKRMKANLERGNIRPEAILDLHGNNQIEAKNLLYNFINSSINNNLRCILVITGKRNTSYGAKGILREKLPIWLREESLAKKVLSHCYARNRDGADGARYILLRKKEKVFYEE